jgi:hypothetical protein
VFAATATFAGLPFPTSDILEVLGCVDSRVDPSDVLGLKLCDGVVMRTIGRRITPAPVRVDVPSARHAVPPSRLVSALVCDVDTWLVGIADPATEE